VSLLGDDSLWVFLSGSDESRFLDDISFGIECLFYRGFPLDNVALFIDQPIGANFRQVYTFRPGLNIYRTADLHEELFKRTNYTKLVIIVTGHGSSLGIDASPVIKPYHLLHVLKSLGHLQQVLVVLGQCFAGTFNFVEARSFDPVTKAVLNPEICILGAADLTTSVSVPLSYASIFPFNRFSCTLKWTANLYLAHFMEGVATPKDIDGDGRCTVLDMYKSAGIETNQLLSQVRATAMQELVELLQQPMVVASSSTELVKLFQQAREDAIARIDAILVNQNFWILNANYARTLEF